MSTTTSTIGTTSTLLATAATTISSTSSPILPWTVTWYYFLRGLFAGVVLALSVLVGAVYLLITIVNDPHISSSKSGHSNTTTHLAQGFRLVRADLDERKGKPNIPAKEDPSTWPPALVNILRKGLEPRGEDSLLTTSPSSSAPPGTSTSSGGPTQIYDNNPFEPIAMGETESCVWLNLIAHRYFLTLRSSSVFAANTIAKTTAKMNKRIQNTSTNYLLKSVDILSIDLGDESPKILGIRLLKGVTKDLAVMVDLDVTYAGGASIVLELTLQSGMKVPVRVFLNALAGCLRCRSPSIPYGDMLALAFLEDPGISFKVDTPITVQNNETLRTMINKFLSNLMRKIFLDMWVLPACRLFYLPMLEPSSLLSNGDGRKNEDLPKSGNTVAEARKTGSSTATTRLKSPTAPKSNLAGRAVALWEARAGLKNRVAIDLFHHPSLGLVFPVDLIVPNDDPEMVNEMSNLLMKKFLHLARDKSLQSPLSVAAPPSEATGASEHTTASGLAEHHATSPSKGWKLIKSKGGIISQRKHIQISATEYADVNRSILTIRCDADRVFSVLSNPEHNRHIDETYLGCNMVHVFDDERLIRKSIYAAPSNATSRSTGPRELELFEVKKRLSGGRYKIVDDLVVEDHDAVSGKELTEYLVVCRSIGGFDEPISPKPTHQRSATEGDKDAIDRVSRMDLAGRDTHSVVSASQTRRIRSSSGDPPVSSKVKSTNNSDSHSIGSSGFVSLPRGVGAGNSRPSSVIAESSPKVKTSPAAHTSSNSPPAFDVYVFGYLIQSLPDQPDHCRVIILSQLSTSLSRLETSYANAKKVKEFIEELLVLSHSIGGSGGTGKGSIHNVIKPSSLASAIRKRGLKGVLAEYQDNPNIARLRAMWGGSTANQWLKNKRWGKSGTSTISASSSSEHEATADADSSLPGAEHVDDVDLAPHLSSDATSIDASDQDILSARDDESLMEEFEEVSDLVVDTLNGAADDQDVSGHEHDTNDLLESADVLHEWNNGSSTDLDRKTSVNYSEGDGAEVMRTGPHVDNRAERTSTSTPTTDLSSRFAPTQTVLMKNSDTAEVDFDRADYHEGVVDAKGGLKIELPYDPAKYEATGAELIWEFASHSEHPLTFGVTFKARKTSTSPPFMQYLPEIAAEVIPAMSLLMQGSTTSIPSASPSDTASLFLPSAVQPYSRPFVARLPLHPFPAGIFTLVWDSSLQVNRKLVRHFFYKCAIVSCSRSRLITSREGHVCAMSDITVQRKGLFKLPFIIPRSVVDLPKTTKTVLQYEIQTHGYEIIFGILYYPLPVEVGGIEDETRQMPFPSLSEHEPIEAINATSSSTSMTPSVRESLASKLAAKLAQSKLATDLLHSASMSLGGGTPFGSSSTSTTVQQAYLSPISIPKHSSSSSGAGSYTTTSIVTPEIIVPFGRVNRKDLQPLVASVDVSAKQNNRGLFIMILDNSYSIMLSKPVSFRLVAMQEGGAIVQDEKAELPSPSGDTSNVRKRRHPPPLLPARSNEEIVESSTIVSGANDPAKEVRTNEKQDSGMKPAFPSRVE